MSFIVKPLGATLKKEPKQGTYCLIEVLFDKHKTEVCSNNTKNQTWNATFNFKVKGFSFDVEVYDGNQRVGKGTVEISEVKEGTTKTLEVKLKQSFDEVGTVKLNIQHIAEDKTAKKSILDDIGFGVSKDGIQFVDKQKNVGFGFNMSQTGMGMNVNAGKDGFSMAADNGPNGPTAGMNMFGGINDAFSKAFKKI